MTDVRIHPLYMDAAETIASGEQLFYSDTAIAQLLEQRLGTVDYGLEFMNLKERLFWHHNIDFIRTEDPVAGKGYKIANSAESLIKTATRYRKRVCKTVGRQARLLDKMIDRGALDSEEQKIYERRQIQNGLERILVHNTPLRKCTKDLTLDIRRDVPKALT